MKKEMKKEKSLEEINKICREITQQEELVWKIKDKIYSLGRTIGIEAVEVLTNIIGKIFNPLNKQICSQCSRDDYHTKSGCCQGCAESSAHFRNLDRDYRDSRLVNLQKEFEWSMKTGFFNPKRLTCQLPRKYRSITCLSYRCGKINNVLSQEQRDLLELLMRNIEIIRKNYQDIY